MTLSVRDASTPTCCVSLRFRNTRGGLELGYLAYETDGQLEVKTVTSAGAELRGATLVITGTIPPPSAWPYRSSRMPSATNIGWNVTTGYFPEEYGPYYGDWLPRYENVN